MLALALALALGAATLETAPRPNLTGRWVLDKERSEEPRHPGAHGGQRAPGSGRPQGGPPPGTPAGESFRGGRPGADPGVLMDDFAPAATLLITEDGTDLLIESSEGRVLRLRPDGRSWKRENGAVETKAEWKGPDLVAESRMAAGGPKLTAVYSRPSEAREIVVSLKMDGSMGPPLTARRVYVPATD